MKYFVKSLFEFEITQNLSFDCQNCLTNLETLIFEVFGDFLKYFIFAFSFFTLLTKILIPYLGGSESQKSPEMSVSGLDKHILKI